MMAIVAKNRMKLDDVFSLKNKRQEYEEVVLKAKGAQRVTSKHLEIEIELLNDELFKTEDKLKELEIVLKEWLLRIKSKVSENINTADDEGECPKEVPLDADTIADSFENVKILEPSFPPKTPPPKPSSPPSSSPVLTSPPQPLPSPLRKHRINVQSTTKRPATPKKIK